MVYFTCNHCGESLKKPTVEKHYNQKCRGAVKNVSCMDCQKDFHGEDYVAHIKCVSEAEKYSGKGFVQKEQKNAKRQDSWINIVRTILDNESEYNLNPQTRGAFQKLQSFDNVPRKKAKFENFALNCLRFPKPVCESVWKVLEKELEKMKQQQVKNAIPTTKTTNGNNEQKEENNSAKIGNNGKRSFEEEATTNGKNDDEAPAIKKSKTQKPTEDDSLTNEQTTVDEKPSAAEDGEENGEDFKWSAIFEKFVTKQKEGIPLEKLKSKVQKKYWKKLGVEDEPTEKLTRKFEKKFTKHLKRCEAVKVEDNLVKCC